MSEASRAFPPPALSGALRPYSAALRPSDQHGAARTVSWRRRRRRRGGCFTSSSLIKGIRHNKRERRSDEEAKSRPTRREEKKKNFINIAPTFINSLGGRAFSPLLLSVVTRACLLRVTWCKGYFKVIVFRINSFGA